MQWISKFLIIIFQFMQIENFLVLYSMKAEVLNRNSSTRHIKFSHLLVKDSSIFVEDSFD